MGVEKTMDGPDSEADLAVADNIVEVALTEQHVGSMVNSISTHCTLYH
jgi:hypothetical protein